MCLKRAADLAAPTAVRFAVLTHDLGKGLTPAHVLPSHHGHEGRGVELVDALCDRLRVPAAYRELARLTAELHGKVHRAHELRASTVLELLEQCDAFRRPQRLADLLLACQADAQGRAGLTDRPYPQRDYLLQAQAVATAVQIDATERAELVGPQIAAELRRRRLRALEAIRPA